MHGTGTNGSTVNYLAAGNCVIDANQAGGGGYAAAAQVQQTIPVTALLTQVISFQAPSRVPSGASAVLQATGWRVGEPVVFTVDSSSAGGVHGHWHERVDGRLHRRRQLRHRRQPGRWRRLRGGGAGAADDPRHRPLDPGDQLPGTEQRYRRGERGPAGHWVAGRGNPVVFTRRPVEQYGACTGSGTNGSTVNYLAAGNCVIDANQAGGGGYAAAAQVQQTIPVTALLTQVISFQAPSSGTVGASAVLQATGGGSGNPVVFTVDSSSSSGA